MVTQYVCEFVCVMGRVVSNRVQMSIQVPFQCVSCKCSREMRWSSGPRRPAIWMVGIQNGSTYKLSVCTQNNAPSFSLILSLSIHYSGFSLFSLLFSLLSGLPCAIFIVTESDPELFAPHIYQKFPFQLITIERPSDVLNIIEGMEILW